MKTLHRYGIVLFIVFYRNINNIGIALIIIYVVVGSATSVMHEIFSFTVSVVFYPVGSGSL